LVDMYEDDENVYLVLEYIEGHDVFEEVVAKGYLDESYAAEVSRQLIEALEYCHNSKHLIHRDIKPENIMLTSVHSTTFGVADVRIKLIDFGLAQDATLDFAQPNVGTDAYLAPETAFGEYGPASDMWSVGQVLCFMLFGGRARQWEAISSEARDFALSLMREQAAERLTATEALSHPWLARQSRSLKRMTTL